MQIAQTIQFPERLRVAVMLSQLLAHLEVKGQPGGADQYRSVVRHLVEELDRLADDDALPLLLSTFPATAELYENQHYHLAGLCRSPMDLALSAELRARDALRRIAARPAA